jgi:CheY-like chemotaxis protein
VCNRLVTFAKGQTLNESCDASAVVSSSKALITRLVEANAELSFEVARGPLPVRCGATQLQELLMNLVLNSAHAVEDHGTIQVTVEPEPSEGRAGVHLCVSDDGAGIPEAVLPRIFDPYFTTKARQHGTGLGLSLVYGIVTGAGGAIDVKSELGRGTRVDIFLPEGKLTEAGGAVAPVPRPGPPPKLLVIDDFEPLLTSLRRSFERDGYACVCFDSCEAGLAAMERQPEAFAAVVSDVSLPGMSGIELAHVVRRTNPTLPLVLMSGDESVSAEESLGAPTLFLRKPFVPGAIVQWLESLGLRGKK